MLAFVGCAAATGSPSPSLPAGWTNIRVDNINLGAARCFWRIADGTEGASFTFTFTASASQATAEIHRVVATHATTPVNQHAGATRLGADVGAEVDPPCPTVTTTADNCMVFAHLFHAHLALAQTHTPPGSEVEHTDLESTVAAVKYASNTNERVFAAQGSTGTSIHNCTEVVATDYIVQRVAVAPGEYTIA